MSATPKAGEVYNTTIGLADVNAPGDFLDSPTITAGDFKVSINRGALVNLATLPSVIPAGSGNVEVDFSTAEMVGPKLVLTGDDPDGQWADVKIVIDIPTSNIDDILTTANLATALTDINLQKLFNEDYDPSSIPGVAGAYLNELTEDDGNGELRFTANALSQSPASGGGFVTTNYRFSTNTVDSDPGSGVVKFNNSTPASVTQIFISQITSNGANAAEIIESLVSGDNVTVSQEDDGTKFIRCDVNGTIVDNGAYYTIPVTIVDSGTLIGNNKSTVVLFGKPAVTASAIASEVDTVLTSSHGSGSWTTAVGFNTVVPMTAALSQTEHDATQTLISALNDFDPATDPVALVTLVTTTTTNTDMRGTNSAFLASSAPSNFSALVITGGGAVDSLVQGFLNNLIAETTAGNIAANFDNLYDNGDALATLTLDTISTLTAANIFTTQMTESYAAHEVDPTLAQSLFLIQQMLTEFAIVGTTLTIFGIDGVTAKATFTLDDTTDPTAIERTT